MARKALGPWPRAAGGSCAALAVDRLRADDLVEVVESAGCHDLDAAPCQRAEGARSGGDPDLAALAATTDRERLIGATAIVTHLAQSGGLRAGLDPDHARDALWALISPDLYRLLVDRSWSHDDYEHWLADTMVTTLT